MSRIVILSLTSLLVLGCYKPLNLETNPIPGNTLALEFAKPVKYVMDLKIDGQDIPVKYSRKNRTLWVEGLAPGKHKFNIHSISYVYGPEYGEFEVDTTKGAHFFIQARKYRSSTPKNKARVSIRAYRKSLRKQGIDAKIGVEAEGEQKGRIRATFRSN